MAFSLRFLLIYLPIFLSTINLLPFVKVHWVFLSLLDLSPYLLFMHLVALLYFAVCLLSRKRFSLIAFVCAIFFIWHYGKVFYRFEVKPRDIEAGEGAVFSVLTASGADVSQVLSLNQEFNFELGCLLEPKGELSGLAPYHVASAAKDNLRVEVISKFKILKQHQVTEDELPPYVHLTLEIDKSPVEFVCLRAPEYLNQSDYYLHKMFLKRLSSKFRHSDQNIIIAGSFHGTPFSKSYLQFVDVGAFNDSRRGFGFEKTWKVGNPFLWFTPDHILYRGKFAVTDFETIKRDSLTHRPILAKFVLY